MATVTSPSASILAENDQLADINADYEQRYGFHDAEHYLYKAPKGLNDNKLAALNSAVWSGGSFVYVPEGVHVELPLQAYFRINTENIQNWSTNVYNLVTKRAIAYADATVEWVDCNVGSKLTMKYPSIYLLGERAHGEVLSIAFAGAGQHQDAGVKVGHEATVSRVGEDNGFVEPIIKQLPMEYAVEMNRLIELQMEGSVG